MAKKAKSKKAKSKPVKKTKVKKTKVKVKTAKKANKKTSKPKKAVKTKQKPAASKVVTKKKLTTRPSKSASEVKDWQIYLAPLYDRVLLEKIKQEEVTKGGLFIGLEASASTYAKAKVLAVGKGAVSKKGNLHPLDVKAGDTVLISSYAGSNIKVNYQELTIVREDEILGIME
ncbi:MAG: co-chaperone GroES [Bdellovibrionales bacterium]|nr:co-chaperone GroES [Bdellovibrionales bacterium]